MNLTQGQLIGVEKIAHWMTLKPDVLSNRIFLLTGKAGTGKTTLIRYAFQKLLKSKRTGISQYRYPNVAGVCMSHKAKHVLTGSIPDCLTFARYFYKEMRHNTDGSVVFANREGAAWVTPPYDLPIPYVVHDEVSMYNWEMLDEVLSRTNPRTKIIFMGDPGQLPPINADGIDADSPIFTINIDDSSKHHLTERVRQSDENPIVPLSDIIYEQIFGAQKFAPIFKEILAKQGLNSKDEGYQMVYAGNLVDKYLEIAEGNLLETKVIAYRNYQLQNLNSAIRIARFGNTLSRFVPGEVIVFNKTLTNDPGGGDLAYRFYNSDEYVIKSVSEGEYLDIHCWVLHIERPEDPDHPLYNVEKPFFRVVHPKGQLDYNAKCEDLRTDAIAEKEKKKKKEKYKIFHGFKDSFGDVSYGYALTCYKAQGSTYRNVFVDIGDIRSTGPLSKKRKLQAIYTALTRASHNAYFISTQYDA